jgi:hypothetical protein
MEAPDKYKYVRERKKELKRDYQESRISLNQRRPSEAMECRGKPQQDTVELTECVDLKKRNAQLISKKVDNFSYP